LTGNDEFDVGGLEDAVVDTVETEGTDEDDVTGAEADDVDPKGNLVPTLNENDELMTVA
jgi:hypothetical protein